MTESLLSTKDAAKYLGLHRRTVSNMANRGEIRARIIGGHWRFDPEDLRTYNEAKGREKKPQGADEERHDDQQRGLPSTPVLTAH